MNRYAVAALASAVLIISLASDAWRLHRPRPVADPRDHSQEPDHRMSASQPTHTEGHRANRLARENSPYLLQHAYNPVDWYPWGSEAFEAAKQQDKPIFLSIGYSTCYWCHVMEQESFDNPEIARLINQWFVPVKVDREERPDLDAMYMTAVQALSGQGGWPMTVILTPEGKPFWGGTYLPPEDRWGRAGIRRLLPAIAEAWRARRDDLLRAGDSVAQALQVSAAPANGPPLTVEILDQAAQQLQQQYDPLHGGFGPAPKFPRTHALSFLMRAWFRSRDPKLLQMVESTLDAMERGGIHDQLGGGLHRYSTDVEWLVPHFEKMLYDQALAARAYLEAFQATGTPDHADMARDILDYVLRDLRDSTGAFYAAEDAGEVGKEGEFYVWMPSDTLAVLGVPRGALFNRIYDVTEAGNFRDEHAAHGQAAPARNILRRKQSWKAAAAEAGMSIEDLRARMAEARQALLQARDQRLRPHRDDKILTDWNGLMIGALAYAGRALEEPRYTEAAAAAAQFLLDRAQRDGGLLHRVRAGQADIPGFLDDYAFLSLGLIELYETTFDARWLAEAVRLAREMVTQFEDPQGGGFFMSGQRNETLIAKTKELYDGAAPSGNSVAALVLVALAELTGDAHMREAAERTVRAFSEPAAHMPTAFAQFLTAADHWIGPSREIVIAGEPEWPGTQQLVHEVRRRFLPRTVVAAHPVRGAAAIEALAPFLARQGPIDGRAAAYVCQQHTCNLPTGDAASLAASLDAAR